jgi:hypothetical protein
MKALMGGKRGKDRITVFICADMDGSKKMPLLVNEKSEKQRCLRHLKSLALMYRHNNWAWIICALFMELSTCLERKRTSKNQKILLFSDQ